MKKLSVVIISYHRENLLRRCLESLNALDPFVFKIFVLVNGPDSSSQEMLKEFFTSHPQTLGWQEMSPSRVSLSEARNILLEKVLQQDFGDWILFLDDDTFLPSGYGKKGYLAVQTADQAKVQLIGGPNLTPPDADRFSFLSGAWLGSFFVSGGVAYRYRLSNDRFVKNDNALILCHMWITKLTARQNLFHRNIQGGEENLFLQNYFAEHETALLAGNLAVYHERRPGFFHFLRQITKYGVGRGQVIRIGRRPRLIHLVPLLFFLSLASMLALHQIFAAVSILTVYLICCLSETLRISIQLKALSGLVTIIAVPLVHFAYAWGIIVGILAKRGQS
jgi:glycosyltransferase involved in cell wall biosynthesis